MGNKVRRVGKEGMKSHEVEASSGGEGLYPVFHTKCGVALHKSCGWNYCEEGIPTCKNCSGDKDEPRSAGSRRAAKETEETFICIDSDDVAYIGDLEDILGELKERLTEETIEQDLTDGSDDLVIYKAHRIKVEPIINHVIEKLEEVK